MINIPRSAANEDILKVVEEWVDRLSHDDYEGAFNALCSKGINELWTPHALRAAILNYHSKKLYPGVTKFQVTPCDTAQVINHEPTRSITRFQPNTAGLVGVVDFDLPLNGQWSNLQAEIEIWDSETDGSDLILTLGEIKSDSCDGADHYR